MDTFAPCQKCVSEAERIIAFREVYLLLRSRSGAVSYTEINDGDRLLRLMEQYCDRPMDLADVTLVLAAEKIRIQTNSDN